LSSTLSIVIPDPVFDLPIEVYGVDGKLPQKTAEQFKITRSK